MEPENFGCPDGKYLLICLPTNGMGQSADGGRAAGKHSGTERKVGGGAGWGSITQPANKQGFFINFSFILKDF